MKVRRAGGLAKCETCGETLMAPYDGKPYWCIECSQEDVMAGLRTLPDGCIQTCITSPPYYGLRNYGCDGQIGLEETPELFVQKMVEVFREVRRVLREDGAEYVAGGL